MSPTSLVQTTKPLLTVFPKRFFRPPDRSEEVHLFVLGAERIGKHRSGFDRGRLRCPGCQFADALVVNELAMRNHSIHDFKNHVSIHSSS